MSRPARVEEGALGARGKRRFGPLTVRSLIRSAGAPFSVLVVDMRPGARHPAIHHARTAEFFVILRGSCRAEIGRRRRTLRPGDFAFLPAGSIHAFHAGRRGLRALAVFAPAMDLRRPDIVRR